MIQCAASARRSKAKERILEVVSTSEGCQQPEGKEEGKNEGRGTKVEGVKRRGKDRADSKSSELQAACITLARGRQGNCRRDWQVASILAPSKQRCIRTTAFVLIRCSVTGHLSCTLGPSEGLA